MPSHLSLKSGCTDLLKASRGTGGCAHSRPNSQVTAVCVVPHGMLHLLPQLFVEQLRGAVLPSLVVWMKNQRLICLNTRSSVGLAVWEGSGTLRRCSLTGEVLDAGFEGLKPRPTSYSPSPSLSLPASCVQMKYELSASCSCYHTLPAKMDSILLESEPNELFFLSLLLAHCFIIGMESS